MKNSRRHFIRSSAIAAVGAPFLLSSCKQNNVLASQDMSGDKALSKMTDNNWFKISLAQWSLHKMLFSKELDHLDFAAKARSLDIGAIEYVNQFFKTKAEDTAYLNQMNQRASDNDVKQLLIMIDGEGGLGSVDKNSREEAINNHHKWVRAAKHLSCHSIRVNAYGEGSAEEVGKAAVEGLSSLSEYAAKENINVIVENHGGYSSNGTWLANVMKEVNMDNCGTLPDFGNFCIKRKKGSWDCEDWYDKYKGVNEMMPYAKAVSAKANVFDENGNEPEIDFSQMLAIVKEHGYNGYVGIEYEGNNLSELDGIIATRDLLRKVRKSLG
jgi:sugar phosphate isomerase/epimerase